MRAERLARSGLLGLVGSIAAAAAAFAVAVVVGNGLGASGTGLFFQALGIFTIASQVLRLGSNSAIVRAVSEQHAFDRHGEAWRTVVIAAVPVAVLSILVAAAMWWSSPWLADRLVAAEASDRLESYLRLMAPFIPAGALLAVLQMASRMLDGIVVYTVAHAIAFPMTRLIAVIVAVSVAGSVFASFAAWLGVIPLWLLVAAGLLAPPFVRDWRRRREALDPFGTSARRFWAFSSTRAVGGSLEIVLEWADVLIVAALTSPAEAGVYAIVTRIVRAGQVVDHSMRLAVSPTISRLLARGETAATRALHTSVTRAMILMSWPFYLTLAIMGPAVLSLFGAGFESGAVLLVILGAAMMLASSAGMLQSIILQGGHSSWQVVNKSIALVISVALNLALVPALGIVGAAASWTVVIVVDTAIAAWQVHRRMGVGAHVGRLLPAMALPAVVFGCGLGLVRVMFGTSLAALIGGVVCLGVAYLAALWLLRRWLGIEPLWREAGIRRRFERAAQAA